MSSTDEISAELRGLFATEADEHLRMLISGMLELEAGSTSVDLRREMLRAAHSLKGAARAVNEDAIERRAHELEEVLESVAGGASADFRVVERALRALDGIEELLTPKVPEGLPSPKPQEHRPEPAARAPVPRHQPAGSTVRVPARRLDELAAHVRELVATTLTLEERVTNVGSLVSERRRARAGGNGGALRAAKAARGDRPLEALGASLVADVRRLAGVASSLEDAVGQARLLPVAWLLDPFPRIVRDLANATGKNVSVEVSGTDLEVDRALLEMLREPLLHLVRNSVQHGIETPEQRHRAGKEIAGRIVISAMRQGSSLQVEVRDDGRGLDLSAIRSRAVERGIVRESDAQALSDAEVARLAFRPGLSTATSVTELAGRGVGLDVVREAASLLHGSVSVENLPGAGATFRVKLPLAISTIRVLLVDTEGVSCAVPMSGLERVIGMGRSSVIRSQGRDAISVDGEVIPLSLLSDVLGIEMRSEDHDVSSAYVIVATDGARRAGFVVRGISAALDVVAKPLPADLPPAPSISGAAILTSGKVALVLDLAAALTAASHSPNARLAGDPAPVTPSTVLIAEDSATTRTFEASLLEAAGYRVRTASDGTEAWDLLQAEPVDLVVADVEMPGIDGFELTARMRSDERFRVLPVVLVTSRSAPADLERGVEVGADAYIVKRDPDRSSLIDAVRKLL